LRQRQLKFPNTTFPSSILTIKLCSFPVIPGGCTAIGIFLKEESVRSFHIFL